MQQPGLPEVCLIYTAASESEAVERTVYRTGQGGRGAGGPALSLIGVVGGTLSTAIHLPALSPFRVRPPPLDIFHMLMCVSMASSGWPLHVFVQNSSNCLPPHACCLKLAHWSIPRIRALSQV